MGSDIRELLNKMKWDANYDFGKVQVWFISRRGHNDIDSVQGDDIINLASHGFYVAEKTIPYHRVLRIDYAGKTVFET